MFTEILCIINSFLFLLRAYKFDGFHLHWMWPTKRDGMEVDKVNLPKLLHVNNNSIKYNRLLYLSIKI